jgi:dUTPase
MHEAFDLPADVSHSAEAKLIPANGKALIDTQISIAVPIGTYGRVAPRSGLGRPWLSVLVVLPLMTSYIRISIEVHDRHRRRRH